MGKYKLTQNGLDSKLARLIKGRKALLKRVDKLHVRLMEGNSKTGVHCWTVSLLPVIDCCNCEECKHDCYDLKSDMLNNDCEHIRYINSAIHLKDKRRFWDEVDAEVKANFALELRINVGGDLSDDDFEYVAELGAKNPSTKIMFFTKNYKGINAFLDKSEFPENVHPIMSAWENVKMENPHQLPCSHVLYPDGRTTAPTYGAYYCQGNCTECDFYSKGCWTLKKNEHVIFHVH